MKMSKFISKEFDLENKLQNDSLSKEDTETLMSKNEFAKRIFTDKKFRFLPNKKGIVKKIQKMSDSEFQEFVQMAFGSVKEAKEEK